MIPRLSRTQWAWLTAGSIVALILLGLVWPLPRALLGAGSAQTVRVLDRNGALLYEERRNAPGTQEWLTLEKIPEQARTALIATEDRSFFEHGGVSFFAIGRALFQNLSSGRVVSGGSTITQQLVRVRLGQGNRSLLGKMLEAYYAVRLEGTMTKDEILEAYMNSAYFGHQAYGIQAASRTYFGKSSEELSLAETSMLIGLLQSPSNYDPFSHMEQAKKRRSTVLAAMRDQKVITEEQESEANTTDVRLAPDRVTALAPHFVFWVLGRSDLPPDATELKTTLDLGLQQEIERAVTHRLELLKEKNVTSAAVVVLDAKTGDVLAMVGSSDYFDTKHDGAVNVALAARQPGSALKPFTYALALSKGDTAATTVGDVQTQFMTKEGTPYVPRNYDYDEHGLVRYREALANSYNIAAVKTLAKVGVGTLLQFFRNAGFTTFTKSAEHYGLALTLGDGEVKLLELARAYGIFPRGGITLTERSLLSDPVVTGERMLDEKVSWLISDILSDDSARLPEFGDQGPLNFPFPVAAKTGTTRNSRDNWTIGFTPFRIVGVWVGNADNSPMKDTSGVTGAGPIFHDTMLAATRSMPIETFPRPTGIVTKEICALSGKLPTPACKTLLTEKFITGTEPKEEDDIYRAVKIDTRNGLLATETCPRQYIHEEAFTVFPQEVRAWALCKGWKQPPTKTSPLCSGQAEQGSGEHWLEITQPNAYDAFELDPLVPNASEKIILEASAGTDVRSIDWYVDGKKVGTGAPRAFRFAWAPHEGTFTIEARSGDLHDSRRITVTNRKLQ